jgi:hypothetical protein
MKFIDQPLTKDVLNAAHLKNQLFAESFKTWKKDEVARLLMVFRFASDLIFDESLLEMDDNRAQQQQPEQKPRTVDFEEEFFYPSSPQSGHTTPASISSQHASSRTSLPSYPIESPPANRTSATDLLRLNSYLNAELQKYFGSKRVDRGAQSEISVSELYAKVKLITVSHADIFANRDYDVIVALSSRFKGCSLESLSRIA